MSEAMCATCNEKPRATIPAWGWRPPMVMSNCGGCHDEEVRRARAAEVAEGRRRQQEQAERDLDAAGVPRNLRLSVLTETPALLSVREAGWKLRALSGGVGCGKSVAAVSWLGTSGLFVSALKLARWPRYDDSEMKRLLESPRLVIDDLGTEFADEKGSFLATLEEVITDREAWGRATLITTNMNAAVFKGRYGARITDRLRAAGGFIELAGKSMRAE